jgi:MFS family permease
MVMAPDLKKVEISTFRLIFLSDGLIDIYLGLVLIPFIVWIYTGWPGSIILTGIVNLVAYVPLALMKKKVVEPRVGMIKPGSRRRKKTNLLVLATAVCVVAMTGLVIFTSQAAGTANQMVLGIPLVFWVFGLGVVVAALVVAWLVDWPRVIVYGILVAVTIPMDAVYFLRTGRIPLTAIPMMVMVGTGIYLLMRFLKRNPKPDLNELA